MTLTAPRAATYADIEALAPNLVGEIIDGGLVTHPRPSPRHAEASARLASELDGPFRKGQGGPGGWRFMIEPELHLGPHVLVPDIAGWRHERLPKLPDTAYLEVMPDWICEVLSNGTERYDRGAKRTIYAAFGLAHYWLVDPRTQVLETFELRGTDWLLCGTFTDADTVTAPPYEACPIELGGIWSASPASRKD